MELDWPFLGWALGVATATYGLISFGANHLSEAQRRAVALWLNVRDESVWASHFNRHFDRLMGARFFSRQRLIASCIASMLAIGALWLLFGPVLGLMGSRADIEMPLGRLLLIGVAINLVADYVSLFETRWLLGRFETVRNIAAQLALLLFDLLVSAAIILLAISAWRLINDQRLLSPVELLVGYTPFAIFFYSTFLTSLWAWAFCVSAWTIRVFARSSLGTRNVVLEKPFHQIGLLAGVLVFAGIVLGTAIAGRVMPNDFDGWVCDTFGGYSCTHAARLSTDDVQSLKRIGQACQTGDPSQCSRALAGLDERLSAEAFPFYQAACRDGQDFSACTTLGYMHENGLGGPQDQGKARALYQTACDGGYMRGCSNLGVMHQNGLGGPQDQGKARVLYQTACDGGNMRGCANLGVMEVKGTGGTKDPENALRLFQQACEGDLLVGCHFAGLLFQNGIGIKADVGRARGLFQTACDGGFEESCKQLQGLDK